MPKLPLLSLMLAPAIFCCKLSAFEYGKPISASVIVTNNFNTANYSGNTAGFAQAIPSKKLVTLMNIPLTPQQKQVLLHYHVENKNISASSLQGLRRQVDVGMNGVPVLDQGQHGSCVTFANTAAIDALLRKKDYISQLCHLELGSYLGEKGYLPSGWDGSLGPLVLNQMLSFGIMSKDKQRTLSCGGLKEYPITNPSVVGSPMSLDDFKQNSENLNENIFWYSMLSIYQRFQWDPARSDQADALLIQVKKSLAAHPSFTETRITFAALLPVDYCSAGACANYHAQEDTWALTKKITNDPDPTFGGHEMVIIGYNDDATAIDHDGTKHQGLLTLRNSWGVNAGDRGNYYMTYDFFKQFVMEVQEVSIFKE